ncbi:MAG: reverse transcriptase-like protein, partial [Actinomycetes bacterium]
MSRRLIIEADGGSRGNPGPAAYGALVRDAETGVVLAERNEHIGRATNNVAEYRGLIAGLEAVRALDPTATVEVRMDSKLVIEQMAGRWKVKHPDMIPLALRAQRLLPSGEVRWQWVPRERNKDADRLVNQALDEALSTGAGARRAGAASRAREAQQQVLLDPPDPEVTARGAAAAREALRRSTRPSPAALVAEFHERFELVTQTSPSASDIPGDLAELRQRLLEEEVSQLRTAVGAVDVAAVARELADVVYVAYGTALTYGIDLDAVLA